ncbi:MAG: DUF3781 domain-containing protein [Bacteroidales bacterium]|jgi:hypothetical protein|nr:DUF3781 domain-containing protein [Bacteroidales bacterium]
MKKIEVHQLLANLNKIHTTKLGKERIRKNLCLEREDVVDWCIQKMQDANSAISPKGKNWYINGDNCEITVNAYSYTIITAHKRNN